MPSETKLERAIQDTALEYINEDIRDILNSLNTISTEIPIEVRSRLAILSDEIKDISFALKDVPEQFDRQFSEKINTILEVSSDFEKKSQNLQFKLFEDFKYFLSSSSKEINLELNKNINNGLFLKKSKLYSIILISSILGSIISTFFSLSIFYFLL